MKIALVGYGNMGQEIARIVKESGVHEISSISFEDGKTFDEKGIKNADVVIDFTSPEIVLENVNKTAELGKNMVIGTTGWYDNLEEVASLAKTHQVGIIYGQNFSVGANIYFKIIEFASRLFNKFGGYDVYGLEVHHTGKKDSPSGTARKISQIIMANFKSKKVLQADKLDRQIKKDELHFASIRGGRNNGFHEVVFDSPADEVKLTHQAHNRSGFAQGAILAAEFIVGKKGIYSFDEMFK